VREYVSRALALRLLGLTWLGLAWIDLAGEATIVPPSMALLPGADTPVRLMAFAWTTR